MNKNEFKIDENEYSKLIENIGLKKLNVKLKKIDERAVIPSYAHVGDVGMDFVAIDVEYDANLDVYIYHTGLAFESDFHYGQFIFPRSSNRKTDAYLCNSVGIIDSAIYRGEIMFCYKNRDSIDSIAESKANAAMMDYYTACNFNVNNLSSDIDNLQSWLKTGIEIYNDTKNKVYNEAKELKYAPYKVGDKIGQMVMLGYPDINLVEADTLSDSERGSNGFGSTDKK